MASDILEAVMWSIDHGAAGVLAVACVAQGVVIQKLWKERNELQEKHTKYVSDIQKARIDDIQAMTTKADQLHEKSFKTADDLGRAIDVIQKRIR